VKATLGPARPDGKRFRRHRSRRADAARRAQSRVAQYGMVESIGWTLPIDDTHYRIYVAGRVKQVGELAEFKSRYNGKAWGS
jgi:hypothetical protein